MIPVYQRVGYQLLLIVKWGDKSLTIRHKYCWVHFLDTLSEFLQERVFLVAQGLELEREQLNFPEGQLSKKNRVKVLGKREREEQDSGLWKREMKKLKTKQNKNPNKLGEVHIVMTPFRSH